MAAAALAKRRRRIRRADKPPVAATLLLDGNLKGDIGYLSDDLFAELFPQLSSGKPFMMRRNALDDIVFANLTRAYIVAR